MQHVEFAKMIVEHAKKRGVLEEMLNQENSESGFTPLALAEDYVKYWE